MSVFDLLFIAVFLTSVATLLTATVSAVRGRGAHALRILRAWGLCTGLYMGIVVVTSLFLPRRVMSVGEPQCADDWCIGVESVNRTPAGPSATYTVILRLSSRARRVAQRENGVAVYLTDSSGRRYDPAPDPASVPFNALLQPQESIRATRVFQTPAEAREVGLVIAREGGFQIGWFIIGYETWFRKPTLVRLPSYS